MNQQEMRIRRVEKVTGTIRVPSDKSLTHRAFLFAALATGPSRINCPLLGDDCLRTIDCLQELGVDIEVFEQEGGEGPFALVLPPSKFIKPDIPLYCGNSGTTIRLLTGILAGMHGVDAVLTGDSSLSRRPMDRIVQPLSQMGGDIEGSCPPLTIRGRPLSGTKYKSPVASAQVKSAVLLAGLSAQGATWVTEPSLSRDHTERMFEALGIELLREGDLSVGLLGGQRLGPLDFLVPGDISSAAFFMVAASILPGSKVTLSQVGINPTRTGVLDILRQAGASVTLDQEFDSDGEPVADITVASGGLKAFEICGPLVPRLIDEIPILAVLATQCEGVTVIRDASELRVKESDRIELVANGLNAMGAHVEPLQDGLKITGPSLLTGATIDATGDHRIAMSFAIAGMVAMGETRVTGAESISTSYPQFESDLAFVTGREMA